MLRWSAPLSMLALLLALTSTAPTAAFAAGSPRSFGVWRAVASAASTPRPSTSNCTWRDFQQKLDHFSDRPGSFVQRLCIYDAWWRNASLSGFKARGTAAGPIFFYTGNESPVDEYVNQTGLMWQLGERMGAMLVWAEHRCEPKSRPAFCGEGSQNCVGYCTIEQALADYAAVIADLRHQAGQRVPVIAFGGSYGGMLSGWMRMKMPEVIDGAIAASAPIWQLATTVTQRTLDWPTQAISRGVSAAGGSPNQCFTNLRAAWPLIEGGIGQSQRHLRQLSRRINSCSELRSARSFTSWAQSAYFLLAEGNYPFPSTYIPSAVGNGGTLPPWPMRVACESLSEDLGIRTEGSTEQVNYTVTLGDLKVTVDWSHLTSNSAQLSAAQLEPLLRLARQVAEASGVWYNVSGTESCWRIQEEEEEEEVVAQVSIHRSLLPASKATGSGNCPACPACDTCPPCPVSRCAQHAAPCNFTGEVPKTFAWTSIVCNDDLSQISASGVGHDFYWPPAPAGIARNYTVASVVGPHGPQPGVCGHSLAAQGLFGAPKTTDPWSEWLTAYYGGRNISHHRNIVWSNGALDPWSGMGVYPSNSAGPQGPMVQEINEDGSQIALVLDLGAHHLDLMFSDPRDPPCAPQAREIERQRIQQWCQEAYDQAEKVTIAKG